MVILIGKKDCPKCTIMERRTLATIKDTDIEFKKLLADEDDGMLFCMENNINLNELPCLMYGDKKLATDYGDTGVVTLKDIENFII